ncbi:MAG: DEAD/DEAH box helicase [Chromatiales bacterium]|jgi:ATP-dependent RNA helicase RhlB|nr:DEAD/DEAH box helicase [Chromatiales bacterium]
MQNKHLSNIAFSELGLPAQITQAVTEAGFTFCTPIQAQTLPLALQGRDVCGQSQTGTGKTATFLIALFNRLLTHTPAADRKPNQPRAVVIAPTRELAIQIHRDALLLGKYTGFNIDVVYGGTGYREQRESLEKGVDILIGTPGRIIDYHKQHVFDFRAVEVAVLDEADRMFDLGFIKDIRFLLRRMPKPELRLNMMFSATLSLRVLELAYEHMNNPQEVRLVRDTVTADNIEQSVYYTSNNEKIPLLVGLLRKLEPTRILVFVNTKEAGHELREYLNANGIHAETLSGDVPQKKRIELLAQFKDGQLPLLVATDVAARGLHIPDVSHVINYDLPHDPEDYVHRIGRTARAGAAGEAISFACETYAFSLPEIETYIGHKIKAAHVSSDLIPTLIEPEKRKREEFRRRPRSGRSSAPPGGGNRRHRSRSRRTG